MGAKTLRICDIIEKKKEGNPLSDEEIEFVIFSYAAKDIPDYQISAFLMAICFVDMNNTSSRCMTNIWIPAGKTRISSSWWAEKQGSFGSLFDIHQPLS